MSKDIWKAKALNYDALRFSFFIIIYSHISSVLLCLMFAHISSYKEYNNIMISANPKHNNNINNQSGNAFLLCYVSCPPKERIPLKSSAVCFILFLDFLSFFFNFLGIILDYSQSLLKLADFASCLYLYIEKYFLFRIDLPSPEALPNPEFS